MAKREIQITNYSFPNTYERIYQMYGIHGITIRCVRIIPSLLLCWNKRKHFKWNCTLVIWTNHSVLSENSTSQRPIRTFLADHIILVRINLFSFVFQEIGNQSCNSHQNYIPRGKIGGETLLQFIIKSITEKNIF